jgi:UDP-glucose 6-dehydrogenase
VNVAIFGAGDVGCVTAARLAAFGHRVWLVEIHPEKLALLQQGQSPVFEPKLDSAFREGWRARRILPVVSGAEAVPHTEVALEGQALEDFQHPPFVIAGTDYPVAAQKLEELYQPLAAPYLVVAPGTASLLKYACNAFHAVKIVFANEIASLETAFGADANAVMETFCLDRSLNLSAAYLRPGFAFGGACLPKDLHALNRVAAAAASAARYGR